MTIRTALQSPDRRIAPVGAAVRRVLLWAVITLVLLAVFGAYLRPDMAFQMAQQLWSCF